MDDVIHQYTRAEAIEDGFLIDVSETAKEAGFRYPVAVTHELWEKCIAVRPEDEGQDEMGRLWDVLSVLRYSIRQAADERTIVFQVLVAKGGRAAKPITLKAEVGPGDDFKPVITLMLPHED